MHLQYPIKNYGYALVQPLPHASLNLQFCKAFLDFRYYMYIHTPRLSFSRNRGDFYRNSAFRLHDQHGHALALEPSTWRSWNLHCGKVFLAPCYHIPVLNLSALCPEEEKVFIFKKKKYQYINFKPNQFLCYKHVPN